MPFDQDEMDFLSALSETELTAFKEGVEVLKKAIEQIQTGVEGATTGGDCVAGCLQSCLIGCAAGNALAHQKAQ